MFDTDFQLDYSVSQKSTNPLRVLQEKLLTRAEFIDLVNGDIEWLAQQPCSLEREHVLMILRDAPRLYYRED
jgi:hypothetical protein